MRHNHMVTESKLATELQSMGGGEGVCRQVKVEKSQRELKGGLGKKKKSPNVRTEHRGWGLPVEMHWKPKY